MAIQIKNATRDDLGGAKDGHRFRLLLGIIVLLVGLVLLGVFYWNTETERENSVASQRAAPVPESSAARDSAPPVVHSWTPSEPGTRPAIKLAVSPAEATYPLGENGVFFVNIGAARLPSRGAVTLVYNPRVIEVTNIRPALGPAAFTVSPQIENGSGWATVSLTSTATGQEKRAQIGLFTVEFKAIGIGRSAVVLTGVAFTDARGSSVPVEVDNGELEISGE